MDTNNLAVRRFAERKDGIANAQPERHTAVRRAAEALSRKTVDLATIELLMEALGGAVTLAYERSEDGMLVNVDPRTGRVLFPLPWGRLGHTKWGITPSEGNVLRRIMQDRQGPAALWLYDSSRRCWYINRTQFRTLDHALEHLRLWPITVAELRRARAALVARQVGNRVAR